MLPALITVTPVTLWLAFFRSGATFVYVPS